MNPLESNNLLIPTFSSYTLVNPYEIAYLKAMQNYVLLYMQDGSQLLASISFGKALKIFEAYNIRRCHRSYAVQISKVIRYLKNGNVELLDDIIVPVARRRRTEVLKMIEEGG